MAYNDGSDSDYASNATNYSSNATNYSSNATNYASNATNYASNATNYASNATNYSSNATNYSSNATNYSSNATNYSSNATNNATNYAANGTDYDANATNYAANGMNYSDNTPKYAATDNSYSTPTNYGSNYNYGYEAGNSYSSPGEAANSAQLNQNAQTKRKIIEPKLKVSQEKQAVPSIVKSKVDADDLQNGKLLSQEQAALAQKWLAANNSVHMKKGVNYEVDGQKFSLPFSVTKTEQGQLFAFYYGTKNKDEPNNSEDKSLGQGSFGSVKLAQDLSTGNWVAIKIQKHKINEDTSHFDKEKEMLNRAEQFIGSQSRFKENSNKTKKELIFMPLSGTSFEALESNFSKKVNVLNSLTDKEEKRSKLMELALFSTTAAQSTIQSLNELHDNGIMHRDIHTGNLLLDDNGKATLIDFGLSAVAASKESISPMLIPHPKHGTVTLGRGDIFSPEIVKSLYNKTPHQFTFKDDDFAAGRCIAQFKTFDLLEKHAKELGIPEKELKEAQRNFINLNAGYVLQDMSALAPNTEPSMGMIYINKNSDFVLKDNEGNVLRGNLNRPMVGWFETGSPSDTIRNNNILLSRAPVILQIIKAQGASIDLTPPKDRPSGLEMEKHLRRMNEYVRLQKGIDLTKATKEEIKEYFDLAKRVSNGKENALNPTNGVKAINVITENGPLVGEKAMSALASTRYLAEQTAKPSSKVSELATLFNKASQSKDNNAANPLQMSDNLPKVTNQNVASRVSQFEKVSQQNKQSNPLALNSNSNPLLMSFGKSTKDSGGFFNKTANKNAPEEAANTNKNRLR